MKLSKVLYNINRAQCTPLSTFCSYLSQNKGLAILDQWPNYKFIYLLTVSWKKNKWTLIYWRCNKLPSNIHFPLNEVSWLMSDAYGSKQPQEKSRKHPDLCEGLSRRLMATPLTSSDGWPLFLDKSQAAFARKPGLMKTKMRANVKCFKNPGSLMAN